MTISTQDYAMLSSAIYGDISVDQKFSNGSSTYICVIATIFIAATLLSGCRKERDLSPPRINRSPQDTAKVALEFNDPADQKIYDIKIKAEYGTLSLNCSNIKGMEGYVEYPHGYIDIPGNKKNIFHIHKDYYERKEDCSWNLLGIGIYIYNMPNGRVAITGLTSKEIKRGNKFYFVV